jgi:pimeloyl-ACP methyl ester carboxylesterase
VDGAAPTSRRRVGLVPAALLAALVGMGFLPPVQARGKALAVLFEAIGGGVPRPFAAQVTRLTVELDGVPGHLYWPGRPAPAIVVIPGAAARGKEDPRAVRLARAVAKAGRVVFVPDLELSQRRFVESDLDRLVRSALALERSPEVVGGVTLFGISYGGSFALVAAADPRLEGRLVQVAVFGAYFDLVGVLEAVTTGRTIVAGRIFHWQGPALARRILGEAASEFLPPAQREDLISALEEGDPGELPREARSLYDLLVNRDPRRTAELVSRLPGELQALLERFSPSTVADRIGAPVIAMHSVDDPAVPFAELVRLRRALPEARAAAVRGFRHVDFTSGGGLAGAVADVGAAWRFATWLFAAQE